jgi:hypothetical protein
MRDLRPPGNQAERPLRRTAGVLQFRASTDGIFSWTWMRIKFASILGRVYFVDTYSECGGRFGPLTRQLEILLTPSGIDR